MPAAELGCKSWYIEFAKFVKKVTKPKPLATFIKTLIQLWKNLIESSQKCRFTQGWCWTLGKPSYWWVQWSSGRGDPIKKEGKLTFLFCFSHFLFSFFAFLIFVFFFAFLIFCFLFSFSHVLFSDAALSFHSLPSVAPLSFSTGVGWEPLCTALAHSSAALLITSSHVFISGGEDDDGGRVLVPRLLAPLPRLLHPCQPLPSHQLQPLHSGRHKFIYKVLCIGNCEFVATAKWFDNKWYYWWHICL